MKANTGRAFAAASGFAVPEYVIRVFQMQKSGSGAQVGSRSVGVVTDIERFGGFSFEGGYSDQFGLAALQGSGGPFGCNGWCRHIDQRRKG